tara:strand:+ start:886 stop:1146 length:261 start_codon:yes stop_codon:yes gene_type:complete
LCSTPRSVTFASASAKLDNYKDQRDILLNKDFEARTLKTGVKEVRQTSNWVEALSLSTLLRNQAVDLLQSGVHIVTAALSDCRGEI